MYPVDQTDVGRRQKYCGTARWRVKYIRGQSNEETCVAAATVPAVHASVRRGRRLQQHWWMVFLAGRACDLGPSNPVPRIPRSQEAILTKNDFPQFDIDEVALLITAVQKALERL